MNLPAETFIHVNALLLLWLNMPCPLLFASVATAYCNMKWATVARFGYRRGIRWWYFRWVVLRAVLWDTVSDYYRCQARMDFCVLNLHPVPHGTAA